MRMNAYKVMVLFLAMLMSGCASLDFLRNRFNPPQKPAKTSVVEQWQTPLPHAGKVENLEHFWAQFNDPVLNTLIARAENDNPSIDTALANIKSARANVTIESAANYPTLTGTASTTQATTSQAGFSPGQTRTSGVELDASWEIDLFGKVKYAKDAAKSSLAGRENDWHQARVSLAAEVANNYLDYRQCQLLLQAYDQQQTSVNETARLTQIQAGAGFAAPADAALAVASANSNQSLRIAQQAQCDTTVKALVNLTGMTEPTLRQALTQNDKTIPQPMQFVVNRVPAEVISQRPDIVSKAQDAAAAAANIDVAQANRFPSLSLSGFIGWQRLRFGGIESTSRPWSFGPTLTLPIFDGGKLKSQVVVARANYESALASYQQSVRDAVEEVEVALVNLNSASEREKAEQISVDNYQTYLKATEINWRTGGVSLLDLESARRQLINAQLSLINQQHDRVEYWIALYKALGGDWQPQADQSYNQQDSQPTKRQTDSEQGELQ